SLASPAEPQPRLVSPTNSEPSGAHVTRNTPDRNPLRNPMAAPCNSPLTSSSITRDNILIPWSPTSTWPAKGPNTPSGLTVGWDEDIPISPWGSHTAGSRNSGNSCLASNAVLYCSLMTFSGLMNRPWSFLTRRSSIFETNCSVVNLTGDPGRPVHRNPRSVEHT